MPSLDPRGWPLTVQVPLLVASLMIAVGTAASFVVVNRLVTLQEAHLRDLTAAYLEGIAVSIVPAVERRDVWEAFDTLDRLERRYGGLVVAASAVTLADQRVLASSEPRRFPTLEPLDATWRTRIGSGEPLVLEPAEARARAIRPLDAGGGLVGYVIADIVISELLAERRRALLALFLSNALVTLLLAAGGYAAVRRMMRPLGVLAAEVDRLRAPPGEPPALLARPPRQPEFRRLLERITEAGRAVREREALAAQLAEEEKLARLGRLASGMAHEVNNPLAGLLTAVSTLRRQGDDEGVRAQALDLLERGLAGIRDVVRAALVVYKSSDDAMPMSAADLDDLRFLVQHEVQRRRIVLAWDNRLPGRIAVPAGPVRQALLNLLLNACRASPVGGRVELDACLADGELRLVIADQGPGMPAAARQLLTAPSPDPPSGSGGLGVWTAATLVERLGGRIGIVLPPTGGTVVSIAVPLAGVARPAAATVS
jgi:signal transduction histidine kinase